jgi:hypothetical protein
MTKLLMLTATVAFLALPWAAYAQDQPANPPAMPHHHHYHHHHYHHHHYMHRHGSHHMPAPKSTMPKE